MGWKLASLKRRQNLVTVLDLANSVSMEPHPHHAGGGGGGRSNNHTQQQLLLSAKRKGSLKKLRHTPLTLLRTNNNKYQGNNSSGDRQVSIPPLSVLQTQILSIQAEQINTSAAAAVAAEGGVVRASSAPGTNEAGLSGGDKLLKTGRRIYYDMDYDQQHQQQYRQQQRQSIMDSGTHHELSHDGRAKPKSSSSSSIQYSRRQIDAYRHAVTRQLQRSQSFTSPSAIRRIMEAQRKRTQLLDNIEEDNNYQGDDNNNKRPFPTSSLPQLTTGGIFSSAAQSRRQPYLGPGGTSSSPSPQPLHARSITNSELEHNDDDDDDVIVMNKGNEYGMSNPSMNTLVSKFYSFAFDERPNSNNNKNKNNNNSDDDGDDGNVLDGVDIKSNLLNRLVRHHVFQEVLPAIDRTHHTADTVSSHHKRVITPVSGLPNRISSGSSPPPSGRVTPQAVKELYDYPLNPHKTHVDRSVR